MFDLIPKNETIVVTMTSLEMVEFINDHRRQQNEGEATLRHDDFLRKVPKVLGENIAPKFFGTVKRQQPNGGIREYPCYNFPKREACLMAMSYSYDLQAKVFDRMTALEEAAAKPAIDPMQVLNDPAAMRGLLLTYTEKVIALEERVGVLEPKADALDRIAGAEGMENITTAAKILQEQPKRLFNWLAQNRWIYRRAGGKSWLAYQDKIQAGYLTHKAYKQEDEETGEVTMREHVLLTAKGLSKLAALLGKASRLASVPQGALQ